MQLSNGEHVMGIRKNPEDETYGDHKLAGDAMEMPIGRPLRYTPGLKCDAHLESLRPERAGNHRAIQVLNTNASPMSDVQDEPKNAFYLLFEEKYAKSERARSEQASPEEKENM